MSDVGYHECRKSDDHTWITGYTYELNGDQVAVDSHCRENP